MKTKLLKPKKRYKALQYVDFNLLSENHIKYIWLDIDNTVALWGKCDVSDDVINWVNEAKKRNYNLCLVTNGHKDRVDIIANVLGVECKKSAAKPYAAKLKRFALELKAADMTEIVIIGDQLFTDVLVANKLGAYSILLDPLSQHEWWATKLFNRTREKLVWKFVFNGEKYR